jgi:hypothetical protein
MILFEENMKKTFKELSDDVDKFIQWMKDVDIILVKNTGKTHKELAAWNYIGNFNNRMTPEDAATKVMSLPLPNW